MKTFKQFQEEIKTGGTIKKPTVNINGKEMPGLGGGGGGEKARAMFSKLMLSKSNALLFDEPTDHLDLESISSLNKAFKSYPEIMMIVSNDFELLNTVCNRVIEVSPAGMIDQKTSFDDYMTSDSIQKKRELIKV